MILRLSINLAYTSIYHTMERDILQTWFQAINSMNGTMDLTMYKRISHLRLSNPNLHFYIPWVSYEWYHGSTFGIKVNDVSNLAIYRPVTP